MFTDIALPHPCSPSHWEIFTKEKSAMTFLKNRKVKTRLSGALFGYEVFVLSLDSFYIDCKTVCIFEKLVFQWVAQLW